MNLKQNQADHFNQGLEKIGSSLSSNNTAKNIIEQAKHDLLDLFLDDNLGLESHEQVDKAFDHVKQLLENKIQQTDNEDQKQAFSKLKSSIQRSQRTYNNPDTFINKQEVGKRTKQIKELYDKIISLSKPRSGDLFDRISELFPKEEEGFISHKEGNKDSINQVNKGSEVVILDAKGEPIQIKEIYDKKTQTTTPSESLNIEDRKADIERRKQEELGKFGTSEKETPKYNIKVLLDPEAKVRGDKQTYVSRELMELAFSNDLSNKGVQSLDTIIRRGGYSLDELSKLLKPEIDKIKAKYDAELKTLENKGTYQEKEESTPNKQSKNEQVTTNTEDKTTSGNQTVERTQSQQEEIGDFITQTPTTEESIKKEEIQEENYLDKLLREQEYINNLKEQFPDIKNNPDLIKILDEGKKLTLKDKNGVDFIVSKDGDKYYAADASGDYTRAEVTSPEQINTPNTTTIEEIKNNTGNQILDLFTIDANVMDKENLIEESERNRIKDLSERKYMEANWLQKVGMFGIDRRRQNKKLKKSMDSQRNSNNFIEQGNLQDRIDGNIGTYAQQNKMGIDGGNINRINLGNDNQIDEIAHNFLMGNITKEQAISEFNIAFNHNSRLRMGGMTGTDIMAQLENAEFKKTYKIKQLLFPFIDNKKVKLSDTDIVSIQQQLNKDKPQIIGNTLQTNNVTSAEEITSSFEQLKADMLTNNINQLTENTTRIRVKLRGLTKRPETEELEGVRYDTLENKRREKVAKFFHRGSAGSLGAKAGLGIGLGLAGSPVLGVVAGVTSLGMLLQRAKTRRDTIKEIAKTQEDAINMGMGELENRIAILSKEISKAQGWNKNVFRHFGMGSYHRNLKQLKILESFQQMRGGANNTIVSVDKIINNLKTTSNDLRPLADVLARIDAGQQYQTHFISTTDVNGKSLGREQTAIKRHEMMNELQETCFRLGLIERKENITKTEWQEVRAKIATTPSYQDTIKRLSTTYEQVQQDIIINKNTIARNAAGNYAKSAIAASVITAGVTGIIHGFNGSNTGQDIAKEIKPHEHTNYKLGKFDDNGIINNTNTSGLDQVHNGQTIEIQGESAVDAVKAHSSNSFGNYIDHVKETRELVSHSGLNKATQETLQNAISDKKIEEIMNIAKDAGADEGNRRLVVERWREGMENITEYLSKHNMKDVTIKDIVFDTKTAKMAMQSSTGGADATHRGFEAIVKILEPKTNTIKNIPRSFPWQPGVLAALPFANTYALPGQKADFTSLNPQVVEKRRKIFQLRKQDSSLGNSRWENRHAA